MEDLELWDEDVATGAQADDADSSRRILEDAGPVSRTDRSLLNAQAQDT